MTKATTRAGKRAKKKGRPALDAIRTPSGQISRGATQTETMTETAREARMRVFGLSEQDAKSDLAGSVLGRLYLDGSLGPVLKEQGTSYYRLKAGEYYALDMARYYRLLGYQSSFFAQAQKLQMTPEKLTTDGVGIDKPTVRLTLTEEQRGEAMKEASNKMMAIEQCLGDADTSGRPVSRSVRMVCFDGLETARGWHTSQIRHLVHGLDALVRFYKLEPKSPLDFSRKSD